MLRATGNLLTANPRAAARAPRYAHRGSVLVLVMALLSILFVMGVAFLGTMNFEASLVDSEQRLAKSDAGMDSMTEGFGDVLRQSFMSGDVPFAQQSRGALTAFVDQPGWNNIAAPIEPARIDRSNPLSTAYVYNGFTDAEAAMNRPYRGTLYAGVRIDTRLENGAEQTLKMCLGGPNDGDPCLDNNGCAGASCEFFHVCDPRVTPSPNAMSRCVPATPETFCAPATCKVWRVCVGGLNDGAFCELDEGCASGICVDKTITVVDADGDGIVDSVQADASRLGYTLPQVDSLVSAVNPATNVDAKVGIALRIVPHGGMVNLNDAHPRLVEAALGVEAIGATPGLRYGPLQAKQAFYSPLLEEPLLRRRGLLPPRFLTPSRLQGNPRLEFNALGTNEVPGGGDLGNQLFPPAGNGMETVLDGKHRFWPFRAAEELDADRLLWPTRMEPFTATDGTGARSEYDRRHLVTTVGHDDLLARTAMIASPQGKVELRDLMIAQNRRADFANECLSFIDPQDTDYPGNYRPLPFEYADYPNDLVDSTKPNADGIVCDCATRPVCEADERKGRLQLSLAWLDKFVEEAGAAVGTNTAAYLKVLDKRNRLVHDAFFMLLNHARGVDWEGGRPCVEDADCPAGHGCAGGNCRYLCSDSVPCPTGLACVAGICATPCTSVADCPAMGVESCVLNYKDSGQGACLGECKTDNDCYGGEVCRYLDLNGDGAAEVSGECYDPLLDQPHRLAQISRTAASLTANAIDYMDSAECIGGANQGRPCVSTADCPGGGLCRDIPTRIYLRSFDFGGLKSNGMPRSVCVNGSSAGIDCEIGANKATCESGTGECRPLGETAGYEFGAINGLYKGVEVLAGGVIRRPAVYGLEAQPYITEVASFYDPGAVPPGVTGRFVELFNPYPNDLQSAPGDEYWIYEFDPASSDPSATANKVRINAVIPADAASRPLGPFLVVRSAPPNFAYPAGHSPAEDDLAQRGVQLTFSAGSTVLLVRKVRLPGDNLDSEIVIDQWSISASGNVGSLTPTPTPPMAPTLYAAERSVRDQVGKLAERWRAVVPYVLAQERAELVPAPETGLGTWTFSTLQPVTVEETKVHPVEVLFANKNSFTKPDSRVLTNPPDFSVAFPTTGSLLLVMRHANRAFEDYSVPLPTGAAIVSTNLAFTSQLGRSVIVKDPPPSAGTATIYEHEQIDNGRMPVFDRGGTSSSGAQRALHHVPPSQSATAQFRPGTSANLPWGQFVFDHFTVLPLSNPGPYRSYDVDEIGLWDSRPRVDLNGLRVHGRIDINAAPWTVLAGLPYIPMQRIPLNVRDRFRFAIIPKDLQGVAVDDETAGVVGENLAQAFVAYREQRNLFPTGALGMGDFAKLSVGRSWMDPAPAFRRGTGFLTVGELANARHAEAFTEPEKGSLSLYRIDHGVVGASPDGASYIDAIAPLAALGDWVSVRSQVFTIYGVVRGSRDETQPPPQSDQDEQRDRDEINSRAVRFQETLDRLPTFLGQSSPTRVGQRTMLPYADVNND